MKACQRGLLTWILLASCSSGAVELVTVDFLKLIEQPLQQQLSRFQVNQEFLVPFSSDGCSGGLSAGWQMVSQTLSPVVASLPLQPPWQHCCVAHDRLYWSGSGANGAELRLVADQQLKACVLATDPQTVLASADQQQVKPGFAGEIRQRLETELQRMMPVVAELMFQAVRPGGLPCSGLPWRWGYGWPQCGVGRLYP